MIKVANKRKWWNTQIDKQLMELNNTKKRSVITHWQRQLLIQVQMEIELTANKVRRTIHHEATELEKELTERESKRKPQPILLFILVCACELITIFLSILLLLVQADDKKYVYLTYIIMTVVRVVVFVTNSVWIMGLNTQFFKLYFLLDNIFLVEIASVVTYVFLNYQSTVDYVIGAMVCYPILLFFLVGNHRVMLIICKWSSCQVIIYKSIKIIGSTYFLFYGGFLIIYTTLANSQIFLLWIFTTCGFWAEMCFAINSLDSSESLSTKYLLEEDLL